MVTSVDPGSTGVCGTAALSGARPAALLETPPYQTGGYGPYGSAPRIPNYLGWAIAVLILCFWPTGIAAVVFAAQVDNRVAIGD